MKSSGISSWLQIASNVGLIGGLVLVAVQIQQHRDLTRLQMRLDYIGSFQQIELGMLGEEPSVAWSKSIRDPASLSDVDVKVVDSYLISQMNQWERLIHMEKADLVEVGALEHSIRRNTWFYFGGPFAKRWWHSMRDQGAWDPNFVRLLDAQIERLGNEDRSSRWLDDMRSVAGSPTGS